MTPPPLLLLQVKMELSLKPEGLDVVERQVCVCVCACVCVCVHASCVCMCVWGAVCGRQS